jgi:V/A-type H+-transporting ATPase subunit D
MIEHVSATRTELLARRARIGLATQGRDLLKERRGALVQEFHRLGASALASLDELDRQAGEAARLLAICVAADAPGPVASAALAAEAEIPVTVRTRSVAGVPIVRIEHGVVARSRTGRGYSLTATAARVDAIAERFEGVLERLLEVAALELSVRRLADEISRTTRRMNALEHVVLPELESERAHIALVLEQRELEDRVRLRRVRTGDLGAEARP